MLIKRTFDISVSFIGLFLLIPIFLVIGLWIKSDSKGSVFFRQERIGRYGKPFLIFKFRTMLQNADKSGRLTIGSDTRITRSGTFLRKSKLDELPQLINVLLGQMSIVGPRPEVHEFIECYPEDVKKKVLSIRPGITDRASIEMVDENEILGNYENPRQAYIDMILPIKQKYYMEYVENQDLLLDLKLIFLTFKKIITR